MDHHVRKQITDGLRRRGVDVLTAEEDGTKRLPDPELLDRATEVGRMLFTQDQDLLKEAARRQQDGEPFVGIVFARQNEVTIAQCISDLELLCLAGEPAEFANKVEYLPLK
jgi:predicted nuclease of predicted toxin-antitoxin system